MHRVYSTAPAAYLPGIYCEETDVNIGHKKRMFSIEYEVKSDANIDYDKKKKKRGGHLGKETDE